MKIALINTYNEEYLMKWWLPHHVEKFDAGVVVDYDSNDGTIDLIRKYAPHWQIIQSRNKTFGAAENDQEFMDIERQIQYQYPRSWMIVLNATEFLIGETKKLEDKPFRIQKLVPCHMMIDPKEKAFTEPDPNISLIKQRTFGVEFNYSDRFDPFNNDLTRLTSSEGLPHPNRLMRSLCNGESYYLYTSMYGPGRHYWGSPCEDFAILWYGAYSPFNENQIKRRTQIQHKIPKSDFDRGNSLHHKTDEFQEIKKYSFYQNYTKDLSEIIKRYENI